MTNRYGILSRAYFIYGCPGESRETIQESVDLMRRIKPLGTVFYILDLFPGTALYDLYRRLFGVTDDIAFCKWMAREIGVSAVPGSSFFSEPTRHLVRLQFARGEDVLRRAVDKLSRIPEKIDRFHK